MPVTSRTDALAALRAQKATIVAGTNAPALLRAINRTIRQLRSESNPIEELREKQDAIGEMRDMEADPALLYAGQFLESAALLLSKLAELPDEPTQGAGPDKLALKRVMTRVVQNADARLDPIKAQCAGFLERFYGVYLPERPSEPIFTALLAQFNGGELSAEDLAQALADLESKSSKLR